MGKFIDRTGMKYGRLTVVERAENRGNRTKCMCACECGGVAIVTGHELAAGHTGSCGCIKKERTANLNKTHGMSGTSTYYSWQAMNRRCSDTGFDGYSRYGGVGISVCERWKSFDAFLQDMGEKPRGASIDRIDPLRGYSPDNCRWATHYEQGDTKVKSPIWRGARRSVASIAREIGVPRTSLNKAFLRVGDIEKAAAYCKERVRR